MCPRSCPRQDLRDLDRPCSEFIPILMPINVGKHMYRDILCVFLVETDP